MLEVKAYHQEVTEALIALHQRVRSLERRLTILIIVLGIAIVALIAFLLGILL